VSGYSPGTSVVQILSLSGTSTTEWTSYGGGVNAVGPQAVTQFSIGNYASGFDSPGLFNLTAFWQRPLAPNEAAALIANPYSLLAGA